MIIRIVGIQTQLRNLKTIKASKMIKISSAIFKTFFLSLCIVANTHFAFGQTASVLPPGYTQYLDNNGKPLSAGKVYNYIPSTTTPKTTWQDAGETIANTNPVTLDAGGRAKILGDGSYRQIVKDRNGNTIWDAVTSSTGSGSSSSTATGDGDLVGTIKPWAGMTAPNQYAFTYGQEVSRTTYSALYTAITSSQSVFCASGSPILNGLTDTTNFWVGMSVEISCVAAGFSTIISKTSSTVTLAANANVTANVTAVFYPWGRGNGTTTFNLPDLRGVVPAGNNNMGGVASANLTATYFGATDPNSAGALGGSQSKTLIAVEIPGHNHPVFLNDPGHNHTTDAKTLPGGATIQSGAGVAGGSAVINSNTTGITVRDTSGGFGTANQTNYFGGGIAVSATLGNTGSGYTPGSQTITITGGTCTTQPQFTVTISGGGVFSGTPALSTAGSCTVAPANPAATSGGGGTGGTLNVTYSSQPFSLIPPTRTTNYIIKITPDANSATASGVTSLGGMTGSIACGFGLLCTGNTVSTATGISGPGTTVVGHVALWNNTIGTSLSDSTALVVSGSDTTLAGTSSISFKEGSTLLGGFGVNGFGASTFVLSPDGAHTRIAVSDTAAQLHYDNIPLGKDQYGGSGSVGPGITWKSPCAMCNGTLAGGSGGTPGTYTNVALTGGTGTGATASITVGAGGDVTAVWVGNNGNGAYVAGDILSAASGDIGGTTAFTYTLVAGGSDASIINIGGIISQANPSGGASLTMGGNFNHGTPFKIYTDTCGNPQLAGVSCSSNNSRFTVLGNVPDQNSMIGIGLDTPTSNYIGTVTHIHSGVTASSAMLHFTTLDKGGATPAGNVGSYVGYGTDGNFYAAQTLDSNSNIVTQSNNLTVAQIIGNTGSGCAVGPCPMFYYTPVVSLSPGANTSTDGLKLLNNNAATAGNQQYSPALTLSGFGWKTNATAASQSVDWRIYNIPVEGTAAPSSVLTYNYQVNGGGYNAKFSMSSGGVFSATTGYQIGGAAASGNVLRGDGTNFISATLASTDLSAISANTMLGNWSSGSATPSAQSMPSCSGSNSSLNYTTNTGIGCRTTGIAALGQSNIPFVVPSSGSYGNNGALSGITAVAAAYAAAYCYAPANAIAAGVAAGFYYCVFSSTTAATVYNNVYTSGNPTVISSPTAFSTVGPGAYTQTTGSYVSAYTVTVPANEMGTNGSVRLEGLLSYNNTAGSKAARLLFGGSTVSSTSGTTTTNLAFFGGVSNRGVTNSQVQISTGGMQYAGTTTGLTFLAKDTTSAQDITVQLQLVSAATDTVVLEKANVMLIPGT